MKDLVVFIDSIEGIKHKDRIEISVPERTQYTGSPVAVRDPIALEYIASYVEKFGYNTKILLRALMTDEEIIEKIKDVKKDLVAICLGLHSTYLVPDTLELARKLKSENSEVPIIVGGYHPTGDPAIVLEPVIDYAVIGEGEETCRELLETIKNKNSEDIRYIKGISFVNEDGYVTITPARNRLEFSTLPWPKRYKKIHKLCQPGPLSYPPTGKVAQIAYSRGCPHACDFCVSPKMWGRKIKYRKPEDVVKEMKYLITQLGINNFFFCDLSFNAKKEKVLALCEHLKRLKKEINVNLGHHIMCNTTKMDKELLQQMKRANFQKIDYGIEDVLSDSLERIKGFQDISQIRKALELTNRHGILIRALLMIGYPWETKTTMQKRKEIIFELPIDQLRLCFYVPFPGTAIYDQLKEKIIVEYEGFSTDIPAIRCDGITSEDLRIGIHDISEAFYNSKQYEDHVLNKTLQFPELKKSYWHFFKYLKNKKILHNPVYSVLLDAIT